VAFALSATAFAALFAVAFITDSSASIWFSWYGIPDLLLSPNKIKGTSNESCQRILLPPNFECLPCLVSTDFYYINFMQRKKMLFEKTLKLL
jgi:hypothetical protein